MKRREFFTVSGAAAAGLSLQSLAPAAAGAAVAGRQILELRIYQFASPAKQQAFDDFLKVAAVPALNRIGIGPVGVFRLTKADNPTVEADSTDLRVLLPHTSAESILGMNQKLAWDETFVSAGASVLEAPKSDPAYVRIESSLLLAFEGMPAVAVPSKAASRILQLRIYESHSTERHLKKVEMFNGGGEIAIFRRTGLHPVFFGQALVGLRLPNLTYMVGFDDSEAMQKAWNTFRVDPDWIRIKDAPEYKDTVSNITNLILRPAASSQI